MSVAAYVAKLNGQLAGKTPSRLARPLLGAIVFLVTDAGKKHRFTVRLAADAAEVLDGVHERDGEAQAIVRGSLEAWTAFFHEADMARMTELELYGDGALLETLASLLSLKMSPLAMRIAAKKPR